MLGKEQAVTTKAVVKHIAFFEAYLNHRGEEEEDTFVLHESYDLREGEEDNSIIHAIFKFYEARHPNIRPWPQATFLLPTDWRVLFKLLRACQYLMAQELLQEISKAVEIPVEELWKESVHDIRNKIRSKYRVALHKQKVALRCFICRTNFQSQPPKRDVIMRLPCCLGDVHPDCFDNVTAAGGTFRCPHCSTPLCATGVDHQLMGALDYVFMRKAQDHVQAMRVKPSCPCCAKINWEDVERDRKGEEKSPWKSTPVTESPRVGITVRLPGSCPHHSSQQSQGKRSQASRIPQHQLPQASRGKSHPSQQQEK